MKKIIKKLGLSLMPLTSLVLFAVSCSKPQVTVTFKLNNAKADVVMHVDSNSIIQNAPIASSYHKKFVSWRLGKQNFDIAHTPITEDITLTAHYDFDYDHIYDQKTEQELAKKESANLRVMTFNLLTSVYNNKPLHHGYGPDNKKYSDGTDDGRDHQARDTIVRYQPDIIGFQECEQTTDFKNFDVKDDPNGWYDYFKEQHRKDSKKFPYVIINDTHRTCKVDGEDEEKTIFSTIAYNTNTVEPEVDKDGKPIWGTKLSLYSDNCNCRYLTYGLFHLKNNKDKKFIATSTHWDLSDTGMPSRVMQAKESADYSLLLQSKYNYPIVSAGDYNVEDSMEPYGEPYKVYLEESGYNDTKYKAKELGLLMPTYHLGTGKGDEKDYKSEFWYRTKETIRPERSDNIETIDHIFASPEVKVHYYDIITEERAIYASDHLPSYADLEL